MSRMQKLLLHPRSLFPRGLFVFFVDDVVTVAETVSFLGDPCFDCSECWRGMRQPVRGDLQRCVERHLPITQLVDLDPRA